MPDVKFETWKYTADEIGAVIARLRNAGDEDAAAMVEELAHEATAHYNHSCIDDD